MGRGEVVEAVGGRGAGLLVPYGENRFEGVRGGRRGVRGGGD